MQALRSWILLFQDLARIFSWVWLGRDEGVRVIPVFVSNPAFSQLEAGFTTYSYITAMMVRREGPGFKLLCYLDYRTKHLILASILTSVIGGSYVLYMKGKLNVLHI